MRRSLFAGLLAITAVLACWPNTAQAQVTDICQDFLNNVDDTDTSELEGVMDDLADLGADPHVIILDTPGPGIFEDEQFVNELMTECPHLYSGGRPNSDLLLLYVTDSVEDGSDAYLYGMSIGDNWASYLDKVRYEDTSVLPHFDDRRYIDGMTAFLNDVYQQETGGGSASSGSSTSGNNGSPDATGILVVFGILVAVVFVCGLVWFIYVKFSASKRRKASQAEQARRFAAAERTYVTLSSSHDALLGEVELWLAQLPEADERQLVAERDKLTSAMADIATALSTDSTLQDDVNATGSDAFRDEVEGRLKALEAQITTAQQTSEFLKQFCGELQRQRDNFASNQATAQAKLVEASGAIVKQGAAGFKVDAYNAQVKELEGTLAAAATSYQQEAFVTAHNNVQSVATEADALIQELNDLPQRTQRLNDQISELNSRTEAAHAAAVQTDRDLTALRGAYADNCLDDLSGHPSDAVNATQAASQAIAAARAAVTQQEFRNAEQQLATAAEELQSAERLIDEVRQRQEKLEGLRTSLSSDIQTLLTKADSLAAFIRGVPAGDINVTTQTQVSTCRSQILATQAQLATERPSYLVIAQEVKRLDDELDTVSQSAHSQHSQAEKARRPRPTSYGGGYDSGGDVIIIDNDDDDYDDFGRSRRRSGGFRPRIPDFGGFGGRSSRTPSRSSGSSSSRSSRRSSGSAGGTRSRGGSTGGRRSRGGSGGGRRSRGR